ncbi:MAG: lipid II flippase MurJ [Gammaproteobacteria bacterium]
MKYFLSTFVISSLILIGRLSGLFREVSLANVLGNSVNADIAIALFTLPDIFTAFFLGGGFSLVIVPLVSQKGDAFFKSILFFFVKRALFVLSFIALITFVFRYYFFSFLAPGVNIYLYDFFDLGFLLVCISIVLAGLSSLFSSFLGSKESFFTSYLGTFIFNISIIASLYFLINSNILMSISYGVFFGATIRLFIQILNFFFLKIETIHEEEFFLVKGFYSKFFSAVIFVSTLAILPIISRSFASGFGEGMLAMFHYSLRIVELPVTFLIVPILIAIFPSMSVFFSSATEEEKVSFVSLVLRVSLIFSILICIPLYFFSEEVIRTVYFLANFDESSFKKIGDIFKWSSLTIPALSIISVLQYLISSNSKTSFLLLPSIYVLISHIISSFISRELFGFEGVLISYIATYYILSFLMLFFTIKIHKINFFKLLSKIYLGVIPVVICIIFSKTAREAEIDIFYALIFGFLSFLISGLVYVFIDNELKRKLFFSRNSI